MEKDLALMGCGYWGKNLARNFFQLGALKAIVEQSDELINSIKSDYPGVLITKDFQQILEDPSIKKVAIATPAVTHYEWVKKALEAGKDVLVEKPISIEASHANELMQLSKSLRRVLMVGHILQYHPAIEKLQLCIQEGQIGEVLALHSHRFSLGKLRKEENVLWSFAPHDISLCLSLIPSKATSVSCTASAVLQPGVEDMAQLSIDFESGKKAFIKVNWLSPYKEHKLIVLGTQGAFVFDDTLSWEDKLCFYPSLFFENESGDVQLTKQAGQSVKIEEKEPLKEESLHFLKACNQRFTPKTDAAEGLCGLKVLSAAQESLEKNGYPTAIDNSQDSFIHSSSYVDAGSVVGKSSKIWHFSHVMQDSKIGEACNIGQNVVISPGVKIGNRVKIQNNVSVYTGVEVEDEVFIGPSVVFTNIKNPRSAISRRHEYASTLLKKGATIGANATIVCGCELGVYCFVGAGAVVCKDVKDYALVVGNPARQIAWVDKKGERLPLPLVSEGSFQEWENEEGCYTLRGNKLSFSSKQLMPC